MRFRVGANGGLNRRQERLLEQMSRIPAPRPPLLRKETLIEPPWVYRLLPWAGPMGGILLLVAGFLYVPSLTIPESWGGSLPLRSGQMLSLPAERSQAVTLPQIQGMLILQGPGEIQVERLSRRLISGYREGAWRLTHGQLYFDAESHTPKQILIHTPLLTVRVTGTQFLLGHELERGSRLVVVRGFVEVKPWHGQSQWELLPAGVVLSMTPQGKMERQILRQEFPLDDFRLPAVARRFGSSSVPDDAKAPDLRRLLWHEE